jgi:transposase
MARKRTNRITETLKFLQELERCSTGAKLKRVRALRLLKENEEEPLSSIAARAGVPSVTFERWWRAYRKGGLDALLEADHRGGNRARRLGEGGLIELRKRVEQGEFQDKGEIQKWICEKYGIEYSRTGVRRLLESIGVRLEQPVRKGTPLVETITGSLANRNGAQGQSADVAESQCCNTDITVDCLIGLMNSLPSEYSVAACANTLRNGLRLILKDVDRISIDINTRCDLLNPDDYAPDLMLNQGLAPDRRNADINIRKAAKSGEIAKYLLENFSAQKVSLDLYHAPIWREYYHQDKAYLGTLFLWRERTKPPISERTIALLDRLRKFIQYVLADVVTRHHYAHHLERTFYDIVSSIAEECELGMQERRVLIMRLLGASYKDIAKRIHVAPNTVSKYATSIHQKTGTKSVIDLFATYLTPRLNEDDISIISKG